SVCACLDPPRNCFGICASDDRRLLHASLNIQLVEQLAYEPIGIAAALVINQRSVNPGELSALRKLIQKPPIPIGTCMPRFDALFRDREIVLLGCRYFFHGGLSVRKWKSPHSGGPWV